MINEYNYQEEQEKLQLDDTLKEIDEQEKHLNNLQFITICGMIILLAIWSIFYNIGFSYNIDFGFVAYLQPESNFQFNFGIGDFLFVFIGVVTPFFIYYIANDLFITTSYIKYLKDKLEVIGGKHD